MTIIVPPAVLAPAVAPRRLAILLPGQFVRFAAVGVANTMLSLVVYLALRVILSATCANVLATLLCTVTGTHSSGKVAFGVDDPIGVRHHVKGIVLTGLGLAITTIAVNVFGTGGKFDELVVLVVASASTGTLRFILMRNWVFR